MKNLFILIFIITSSFVQTQIIDLDPDCGQSESFAHENKQHVPMAGAEISRKGQAGWQVLIKENNLFKCGGSLINEEWILTAASCVHMNANPSSYLINLGVYDHSDNEFTVRSANKIIQHPGYDDVTKKYDVALIKMATPVNFWTNEKDNFNIIPICVSNGDESYVNKIAITTGYASFKNGFIDSNEVNYKQHINLTVLNNQECKENHPMSGVNNFIQVCALENKPRAEECGMDRGGPLAVQGKNGRWHLVGLTSYGFQPCKNGGVFTRISTFADYISKIIRTE